MRTRVHMHVNHASPPGPGSNMSLLYDCCPEIGLNELPWFGVLPQIPAFSPPLSRAVVLNLPNAGTLNTAPPAVGTPKIKLFSFYFTTAMLLLL